MPHDMMERISVKPEVAFGKPCISGIRIPLTAILEILEDGVSIEDVPRKYYPDISVDDVSACIEYAIRVIQDEEIWFTT